MKSSGSGPIGGAGRPVGSGGMFGTLIPPITRWMLVVSLAWIRPLELMSPTRTGSAIR